MRIISGRFKGRRFDPPSNITARPTTDFAKESLFNLINNEMDIEGITALDLFSGTGSISYELASRDALHITAIEMSEKHISYIRKMCADLKIDNIRVMRQDVFRYLTSTQTSFDFIFADPPYALKELETIPSRIFEKGLLKEDGLLVLEHGKDNHFEDDPHFIERRVYGSVNFSFFKAKVQTDE